MYYGIFYCHNECKKAWDSSVLQIHEKMKVEFKVYQIPLSYDKKLVYAPASPKKLAYLCYDSP